MSEIDEIENALVAWLESQNIDTGDGCNAMLELVGRALAHRVGNFAEWTVAVNAAQTVLLMAASRRFEKIQSLREDT